MLRVNVSIFLVTFFAITCFSFNSFSRNFSGYVMDKENGEALIGVSVYYEGSTIGTTTNFYGFYSITTNKQYNVLIFSFLGYKEYKLNLKNLDKTKPVEILLEPKSENLSTVVIAAEEIETSVSDIKMGVSKMNVKTIESIPAFAGEVDVIQSILTLPGVSSVGEGTSGFYVRGGNVDQNLILLDEAPIYNSSHLLGFFSVFDPDAVKGVELYKGSINSNYGGRLSSVLEVRLKEGNNKKFSGRAAIGTVFSRGMIEGPIKKNKGSFILSGRRTYIDVLAKPFLDDEYSDSKFYFYDLVGKVNYKVTPKDHFYISAYLGRDVLKFGGFSPNWGNISSTLRWSRAYNSQLFSNVLFYYSQYDYALSFVSEADATSSFDWKSNITNMGLKINYSWYINPNNTVKGGYQNTFYNLLPAEAQTTNSNQQGNITATSFDMDRRRGLENALYLENERKITDKLKVNLGLRYSFYFFLGSYKTFELTPGEEINKPKKVSYDNSKEFSSGEIITIYHNPEPRISLNYTFSPRLSVKSAYNRNVQYIHLMSNTKSRSIIDNWTLASDHLKPAKSNQLSLGVFTNFLNQKIELSVEGFYKRYEDLVEYVSGANLFFNNTIENVLLESEGRAWGLEIYAKKKGRFSGWVSYSYTKSEKLTEGINNNDWYRNNFNREHNVNLIASYQLTTRWSANANFLLASGTPSTLENSQYFDGSNYVAVNSTNSRSNYINPLNHRLDLSVKCTRKPEKVKNSTYNWDLIFSVYNVFGIKNPFSVYSNPAEKIPADSYVSPNSNFYNFYQFSLIGSIIPAITLNLYFNQ